jgi:hypothetical protein
LLAWHLYHRIARHTINGLDKGKSSLNNKGWATQENTADHIPAPKSSQDLPAELVCGNSSNEKGVKRIVQIAYVITVRVYLHYGVCFLTGRRIS